MSDLLVVGSVALDSVQTPFGKVQEALGGSATYFSYSASFFTPVHLVATVGEDFPEAHLKLLEDRGVDIAGLQTSKGRTFRWAGEYGYDLNEAKTIETQLNVFAEFRPVLGEGLGRTPFLFLANIDPELQLDVLRQMKERPRLVALDTMNFWIQGKRDALRRVLAEVDVVTINDGEARQLASEPNLIRAARAISARANMSASPGVQSTPEVAPRPESEPSTQSAGVSTSGFELGAASFEDSVGAAQLLASRPQQRPARTITNDDIARLNQQNGTVQFRGKTEKIE